MRAGQLSLGEDNARQLMRSGKAALAMIDAGASANAKKALGDTANTYGVPLVELPEGRLGAAAGKPGRMSAAAHKGGLGEQLTLLAGESGQ